jgi:hypothetical protein
MVMGFGSSRQEAETRDWLPTGRRDNDAVLFQHAKSLRRGRVANAISGGFFAISSIPELISEVHSRVIRTEI